MHILRYPCRAFMLLGLLALAACKSGNTASAPEAASAPEPTHTSLKALLAQAPTAFPDSVTATTPIPATALTPSQVQDLLYTGYTTWLKANGWNSETVFDRTPTQGAPTRRDQAIYLNAAMTLPGPVETEAPMPPRQSKFYVLGTRPTPAGYWVLLLEAYTGMYEEAKERSLVCIHFRPDGTWSEGLYANIKATGPDGFMKQRVTPTPEGLAFTLDAAGCGGLGPGPDGCVWLCEHYSWSLKPDGSGAQDPNTDLCTVNGLFLDETNRELLWIASTGPDELHVVYKSRFVPQWERAENFRHLTNLPQPSECTRLTVKTTNLAERTCQVAFPGKTVTYTLVLSPDGKTLRSTGSDGSAPQTFTRVEGY